MLCAELWRDFAPDPDVTDGLDGHGSERPLPVAPAERQRFVRGPGRGRGRGRARGFTHSTEVRARIRASQLKHAVQTARDKHTSLANASQLDFCASVVEECFGAAAGQTAVHGVTSERLLVDGSVTTLELKTGSTREAYVDRAIESHAAAQSSGLAVLLRDGGVGSVVATTVYNVSDDASMWITKPKALGSSAIEGINAELGLPRQSLKKGRNCHVPVLNVCEEVLVSTRSPGCGGLVPKLAPVFCPAQPLPRANYATAHDRIARWSAWSSERCGRRIDADGALEREFESVRWKSVVFQMDNLVVNDCVVGLQDWSHPRASKTCVHHDVCSSSCAYVRFAIKRLCSYMALIQL